jgi:flagella basal body P-ring formation protein FlgA
MRGNGLLVVILVLLSVSVLEAEPRFQSHESIRAAIDRLLETELHQQDQEYQAEPARLDPRLRLPECDRSLEAFILSGQKESGYFSIGVRCPGSQPWTVYSKVRLTVYQQVVILKNPVRQGALIAETDLVLEKKELSALRGGYLTALEQAVGRPAKRSLPKGLVLNAGHLTVSTLVKKGQKVTIRARSANFEVNMPGEALADGNEGQRIRVRNDQSQKVVEGTVVGPGLVLVGF